MGEAVATLPINYIPTVHTHTHLNHLPVVVMSVTTSCTDRDLSAGEVREYGIATSAPSCTSNSVPLSNSMNRTTEIEKQREIV